MATLPDYSINVAQPFMEALKGYQLGMGFEAAKRQNILQQQQAQQALQQRQALQDAQRLVFQKPSAENYARLMTLDPKSSEAYQRAWSARNAEQQETLAADLLKQGAAITSGKPEIAAQYLEDKASAIEAQNNGQPTPESQSVRTQARLMKEHPQFALGQIQALLAVNPLGKSASEALAKFGEESRARALQPSALKKAESEAEKAKVEADFAKRLQQAGLDEKNWNVKNLQSQISNRAAQLNLDAQRTRAEVADKLSSIQNRLTALPESAQKLVNESATNAATAKQASNQYTEIAKQLDGLGSSWGALNSLGEWSAAQFGNQDFRTAIQNEYTRLANSAGIKAYKAAGATGGFSDADLNTALAGIPKANSNPKIMAQFMRGMAKEQAIAAALENAKTDWLTQNRGQLGRASGTFLAGDYAVKPGETYADFSARVTKDVVKKFTTPAQNPLVEQIPTDKNPAPMAAQQNIRSQADAILRGGQ